MSHKDNTLVVIVVLLALLLISGFSWGFGGMGAMGGMMFFGPFFMILVTVLIVWLIISLTQENKYKRR